MSRNSIMDLYDALFQLLKSKPNFEYSHFFDYIYGILFFVLLYTSEFLTNFSIIIIDLRILQDIYLLTKSSSKLKLGTDHPSEKIITQLNQDVIKFNCIDTFKSFLKKNNQSFTEMFDHIVKI